MFSAGMFTAAHEQIHFFICDRFAGHLCRTFNHALAGLTAVIFFAAQQSEDYYSGKNQKNLKCACHTCKKLRPSVPVNCNANKNTSLHVNLKPPATEI